MMVPGFEAFQGNAASDWADIPAANTGVRDELLAKYMAAAKDVKLGETNAAIVRGRAAADAEDVKSRATAGLIQSGIGAIGDIAGGLLKANASSDASGDLWSRSGQIPSTVSEYRYGGPRLNYLSGGTWN